jgi:hypothetical protein
MRILKIKQLLVISCHSCWKKTGDLCFCANYRKLNDCFPLSCIDDTLDTFTAAKWFSTLDLKSTYGQAVLHPDDKEKMTYSTGHGL